MSNKVNNVPQHKTIPVTPATPDTGFGKIYIKSDRLWYGLDDLGVETPLSGGGGGGGISLTDLSAVSPLTYNNLTGSIGINQSSGSTSGYLSAADWLTFNGKISGSGTLNRILKWTPSGSQVGNSQVIDDGTRVSVTQLPTTFGNAKFGVRTTTGVTAGIESSVELTASALAGDVFGVAGSINQSNVLYGQPIAGKFEVGTFDSDFSAAAYGVYANASTNSTSFNIGGFFKAANTSAVPGAAVHAIQLQDGTQGAGKFLKSVTSNGHANWANITAADVSGVQGSLTLTTTGSSGAATLVGNTLNIPQYSGGGGGGLTWPAHIEYNETDKTLWVNGNNDNFNNTGFGEKTLTSITSATGATAFGTYALRYLTSGLANTAFGDRALMKITTGSSATAIGSYALNNYTTGLNVVAIGSDSMISATTATHSVAVGSDTLRTTVGAWGNTAIGHSVLSSNTTGEYNTAVGDRTLTAVTTGSYNISLGHQTALLLTTGSSNVIIGSRAEAQSGVSASIVIGREATATASNEFVVGSSLYPAGTLTSESVTANATWSVKINGQACKILINR